MATEIERKFLVTGNAWRQDDAISYCQGYLNRDKGRTVRVRVAGDHGYLTIKGETSGTSRAEYEYEIPLADAEELLKMCDGPLVQKIRHLVVHNGFIWEVDEFLGDNAGLVVAEIELESEDQPFDRPEWVGDEVTDDSRYYNSNLAVTPFCRWSVRKLPYKLRPGYGSDELLIEFDSLVDDRRFVDDLRNVLQQGGFVTTGTIEITYNSLLRFTSPYGVLDISGDEWGGVFGHGLYGKKQQAVLYADKLLQESGLFEKIEVDFADYLMPLEEKENRLSDKI